MEATTATNAQLSRPARAPLSRDDVLALVWKQRRRPGSVAGGTYVLAHLVMLLCVVRIVGSGRFVEPLLGYLAAGAVAAWILGRHRGQRSIAQLPALLVLGVPVFALALAMHGQRKFRRAFDFADRTSRPPASPRDLGPALIVARDVERVLGAPVVESDTPPGYRSPDGSRVAVSAGLQRTRRRPAARGEPVPGLGDAAYTNGYGLWGVAGDWTYRLAGIAADGRPLPRQALVELARLLVSRLPTPDDFARHAHAKSVPTRGVRGVLHAAFTILDTGEGSG